MILAAVQVALAVDEVVMTEAAKDCSDLRSRRSPSQERMTSMQTLHHHRRTSHLTHTGRRRCIHWCIGNQVAHLEVRVKAAEEGSAKEVASAVAGMAGVEMAAEEMAVATAAVAVMVAEEVAVASAAWEGGAHKGPSRPQTVGYGRCSYHHPEMQQ